MYRKFRNVPIFKDFPPICPYFLGLKVGKYVNWGGGGGPPVRNPRSPQIATHLFSENLLSKSPVKIIGLNFLYLMWWFQLLMDTRFV